MANNALLGHRESLVLVKRIGAIIPEGEVTVILSKKLNRNVTKVSRMAFYFLASFKHYVDKNFK